ncbi:MATE family efflux transporter [Paucilactobacillus wasatchensis]|uniref:Multi antimicrobial extrusion protein (Na(+)/drug antiporter) n=1 Tax=Paucilactobacillus wasatchensis TaxID=1335616 RepID=A0A0D0Y372_9LACO|nr:MATE family efflux transporter [Paucilactobacillus wasatchensis]KIS02713.1 Multi antimicrobial extrusion protein (Na(+)/drug antiporter) [Paucilactobacillus wasatchensis]
MRDLTKGNPIKLILMFTTPLFIGNLFQQLYNFSDVLVVGQTLGVNALAAVGSTGSLNFLIIGFASGLTAGLSIVTAQRFGARDYRGVRRSFAASIMISLIVAIVLTVGSLVFLDPIMHLMSTPAEIYTDARKFISIIFMGIFASVAFNLLSNEIRALGDSKTPLWFLIIGTLVNLILELLFILVFHWGVAGAGWATLISQVISSGLCVIYIYRHIPMLQVHAVDFVAVLKEFGVHAKFGFPMAFQSSIIAIGAIFMQSALNGLGTTAVAATTSASKIDQLASLPMMSFGITMATFAAQNIGAGEYERIIKGVRQALFASVAFSVLVGVLIIVFGQQLVMLFVGSQDVEVLRLSQVYFNVVGSSYSILAILFIIRYTLQGLGQSVIPTIAGIAELFMRSFSAIVLAGSFGYAGACFSDPLAWLGSTVVLIGSYLAAIRRLHKLQRMRETVETTADPVVKEQVQKQMRKTLKLGDQPQLAGAGEV